MGTSDLVSGFASQYGPLVRDAAQKYQLDPQALMSQIALETGWGQHVIPGTNNPGNLKATGAGGASAVDNALGTSSNYQQFPSLAAGVDAMGSLLARKYQGGQNLHGYAEDPNYNSKLGGVAKTLQKYASDWLGYATGSTSAQASELTPEQRGMGARYQNAANGPNPPPSVNPAPAPASAAAPKDADPWAAAAAKYSQPDSKPSADEADPWAAAAKKYGAPAPAPATAAPATAPPAAPGVPGGAAMPPSPAAAPAAPMPAAAAPPAPAPAAPTFMDQLGHQAGLFGRDVAQVAGSVPALVVDPVTGLSNKFLGTHFLTGAASIDKALDAIGVPREADARERIIGNVTRAVGQVGAQTGAAKAIGAAADSPMVANVAHQFADKLGLQVASAAGGAGAASVAQEQGASPGVQMGAGLLGSMVAPVGAATTQAVKNMGGGLLDSFRRSQALNTAEGQTAAARDLLAGKVTSGAANAREIFDNSNVAGTPGANTPAGGGGVFPVGESPIPGVTRTLPERTQNPDVAQTYRSVRDDQTANGAMLARESRNTAARNDFIGGIVGDQGTVNGLVRARTNATSTLYDQASNAVLPVDEHLQAMLNTPSGRNAVATAQRTWADAPATRDLPFFIDNGNGQHSISGRALQQIKFALDGLADNAMSSDNPAIRRALGGEGGLRPEFMQWAAEHNDNYRQANEVFANHSRRINEMQYLQDQNLTSMGGDITLGKVDTLIKRIAQNAADDPRGAGSVSEQTLQHLNALRDDLRISQTPFELGKAKGTDTAQKLTADYLNQGQTPLGNITSKAAGVAGKATGATAGGIVGGVPGAVVGSALGEAFDASRKAAADRRQQGLLVRMAEQMVHPDAVTNVGAAMQRKAQATAPQLPAALGGLGPRRAAALPNLQAGLLGLLAR